MSSSKLTSSSISFSLAELELGGAAVVDTGTAAEAEGVDIA